MYMIARSMELDKRRILLLSNPLGAVKNAFTISSTAFLLYALLSCPAAVVFT